MHSCCPCEIRASRPGFVRLGPDARGGIRFAVRLSQAGDDAVLFARNKGLVGLDIGSSAVKAIELKPSGKGYKVGAIAVEPVPPDSIVDGSIVDSAAVTEAVRRVFANKAFKSRDV